MPDYSYHEGDNALHLVKTGNLYYLVSDNKDSLAVSLSDNGTKMKAGNKVYVKINPDVAIAEHILLDGDYEAEGKPVAIHNGTVSGLDTFKYLALENDYIGPGTGNMDIIYLNTDGRREHRVAFAFQFEGGKLMIYKTICTGQHDGNCIYLKKGALAWTLMRKQ